MSARTVSGSAWIAEDRKMLAMMQVFHSMGADSVIGASTIVEVSHARVNMPRLQWALSRVKIEPVTEGVAKASAKLRGDQGAAGHDDDALAGRAVHAFGKAPLTCSVASVPTSAKAPLLSSQMSGQVSRPDVSPHCRGLSPTGGRNRT